MSGIKIKHFNDGDLIDTGMPSILKNYLLTHRLTTLNGKKIQFVGLIELDELYFFFPKRFVFNHTTDHLSLILKTLTTYSGKLAQTEITENLIGKSTVGKKVSLAFSLLNDFRNHGHIQLKQTKNNINGTGKINWKKTFSNSDVAYSQNGPIYLQLITNKRTVDEDNLLIDIHKKILALCDVNYYWLISDRYLCKEFHHLYFKDEKEVQRSIAFLKKFITRIYSERTMNLVKWMIDFLSVNQNTTKHSEYAFGTQVFQNIWESVCKDILGHDESLINELPQPKYHYNEMVTRKAQGNIGQIPDTLLLKGDCLFVIDAKYYDILKYSPPGWKDLAKQFFYGWSLKQSTHLKIKNIFAFPGDVYTEIGHVKLLKMGVPLDVLGKLECIELPIIECLQFYVRKIQYQNFKKEINTLITDSLL